MTKPIFTLLLAIQSLGLFAQNIEFFVGPNKNIFHKKAANTPEYNSSYSSGYGYCAGIAFDNIKNGSLPLRFTLQFDRYSGKLESSSFGLGGGSSTKANTTKDIITVGLFPINIRLKKRLDLNIGIDISRLIHENTSGTTSGWQIDKPNWSYNIDSKTKRNSNIYSAGLKARLAYDFFITKSIIVCPVYLFYYGFTNEFSEITKKTKSMRHYACVGIKKVLK